MTQFQIMSDLHIENYEDDVDYKNFITPKADVLILAGDIGRVARKNQLENFLKKLCPNFKAVLYVLGNHEYYKVDNYPEKTMEETRECMAEISSKIDNLYILNRDSIIIGDVCIAGCTLWSYTTLNTVPSYIVRIKDINSVKYNSMFFEDLNYIKSMISYCKKNKLKLVVVSHYSPSYSVSKKKKRDKYTSLYCSNLDGLLNSRSIHTWICGHVHKNFDLITTRGTRLLSNQKGKPKDNILDFSLEKIIQV